MGLSYRPPETVFSTTITPASAAIQARLPTPIPNRMHLYQAPIVRQRPAERRIRHQARDEKYNGIQMRSTVVFSGRQRSPQTCSTHLLQPVRHHSCESSRVRYAVRLCQGRSQFLVELDYNQGSLKHSISLQRTKGRL